MATKLRKRLSTKENNLLKFDNLELKDVICSICQSILVEPVTLPCYHYFCQRCFNGSVENNALCCPLCRLRIGSWLRTATKRNNLVNDELWHYMQTKFSAEINTKLKGGDVYLEVTEKPAPRLSAPGEIRSEYEMELKRLREERIRLENKDLEKTELLIKKIQVEEAEAQKRYVEMIKQDELLAKQMQQEHVTMSSPKKVNKTPSRNDHSKPRLKPMRIDGFLTKAQAPVTISSSSPILTDDNTSTDNSSPTATFNSRASPEMVPNYCNSLNNTNVIENIHEGQGSEPPESNYCADLSNSNKSDQETSQTNNTDQNKKKLKLNETNLNSNEIGGEEKLANYSKKETNCKEKKETNLRSNEIIGNEKLVNIKQKETSFKAKKEINCKEKLANIKKTIKLIQPPRKSLPVSLPLPQSRIPQNKHLITQESNKFIPLGVIQQRSIFQFKNKRMFMTYRKGNDQEMIEDKKTTSPEDMSKPDKCAGPSKTHVQEKVLTEDKITNEPKSSVQYHKDAPVRPLETDSVDSMLQELCYFKPIEKSSAKSVAQCSTTVPVRVPCARAGGEPCSAPERPTQEPPSRAQYIEGLCRLRHLSLATNLPSAFVIALDSLKVKKVEKCETNKRSKRSAAPEDSVPPIKKNAPSRNVKSNTLSNGATNCRRRTRSMTSISKGERTPKKAKIVERKSMSERKPQLRSDSKRTSSTTKPYSPVSKMICHDKIRPITKNLSEPLNNCDVKTILQQIRIQKQIEQEKQDMELARKIDAELNGRRRPARLVPGKRQVTINYALRPAKKLKT